MFPGLASLLRTGAAVNKIMKMSFLGILGKLTFSKKNLHRFSFLSTHMGRLFYMKICLSCTLASIIYLSF
jgi:hypothetical protein